MITFFKDKCVAIFINPDIMVGNAVYGRGFYEEKQD